MPNCSNCSAPLPSNSTRCEYCGSRNDIDLKSVHYFTTHEIESDRICPRCNIKLRTIDLKVDGKFLIERCDQCLGLFFDPNELETLLNASVTNVFSIDRSRLENLNAMRSNDYGVSYVKCPVCGKIMNRVNFGTKSGVIVDRCREHGVWLDGGELRSLFEWMKAGGKLLDQERKEELKKEEEKQEREKRKVEMKGTSLGEYADDSDFGVFGGSGTWRRSNPDLFDIMIEAVRFFLK